MLSSQNFLPHDLPAGLVQSTEGSCVNAVDPDGMCGERTGEAMLNSEWSWIQNFKGRGGCNEGS
jgi:hypothetical protein